MRFPNCLDHNNRPHPLSPPKAIESDRRHFLGNSEKVLFETHFPLWILSSGRLEKRTAMIEPVFVQLVQITSI
jgi:hypothetical protein